MRRTKTKKKGGNNMFPNTSKTNDQIASLRAGGATPINSQEMRELIIAQAAPWFPGNNTVLAEEHLVDRRIIPSRNKKKEIFFASNRAYKKVLSVVPK